jgi:superfamily II DNA or RNA helicase
MAKTKDEIGSEALEAVLPLYRAGVGIATGGGKTLLGLRHMNANYTDYVRFLVVGPKNEVYTTWKEEAVKHKHEHLIPHFEFTTYLSLHKHDPEAYDVIYLDECHSLKETHKPWLNTYRGKILGLSGTPPKYEKSEKGRMVAEFCPIVYKYITDQAVEDDILNDYEIIIHKLQLSAVKNMPMHKNGKTWFSSERSSYDFWTSKIDEANTGKMLQMARIMRMRSLMEFPTKEHYARILMGQIKNKVLLFANTQDQADKLCTHSFHSENPLSQENLIAFKEGRITKLSCVHQLSEGVNVPDLKEIILMHAYSNERKAAQRIGRALRLDPNDKATIHILCYVGTVDEQWVKTALEGFDPTKIRWK